MRAHKAFGRGSGISVTLGIVLFLGGCLGASNGGGADQKDPDKEYEGSPVDEDLSYNRVDLPQASHGGTAVVLSGKHYHMLGLPYAGDATEFASVVPVYDPATGQWSSLEPAGTPPVARGLGGAAVFRGKIYVYGGYSWNYQILGDFRELDLTQGPQGTWRSLSPTNLPTARYNTSLVVVADRMFLIGGAGGSFGTQIFEYVPSVSDDGTFVAISGAGGNPDFTSKPNLAVIDGILYALKYGGQLYRYDPSNGSQGTWTLLSPGGVALPSNTYGAVTGVVNGKIYIFSGQGRGRTLHAYDPNGGDQGAWSDLSDSVPAKVEPRYNSYVGVSAGKIYFFSGFSGSWELKDFTIFDPVAMEWTVSIADSFHLQATANTSEQSAVAAKGRCAEDGVVSLTMSGTGGSPVVVEVPCTDSYWSTDSLNVSSYDNGTVTVSASFRDALGHVSTSAPSKTLQKNAFNVVCDVDISEGHNISNPYSFGLTGSCSTPGFSQAVITLEDASGNQVGLETGIPLSENTWSSSEFFNDVSSLEDTSELGILMTIRYYDEWGNQSVQELRLNKGAGG